MANRGWMEADLAPGDQGATRLDVAQLMLHAIHSRDDPAFRPAYQFLGTIFGATGALESFDVLARRFAWPDSPQEDGWALRYEMLAISDRAGNLVAVRDHTAALAPAATEVVVHLSHVLVAPEWRRSGIGGWLRALPLQLARDLLKANGVTRKAITLIAEMEAARPEAFSQPASLLAYEKAGFRKIDPTRVAYFQPDLRAPAAIEASGGPRPLPFSLVIRQTGREHENELTGARVRALTRALYRVYRDGCRAADLAPLLAGIGETYPEPRERVRLMRPAQP